MNHKEEYYLYFLYLINLIGSLYFFFSLSVKVMIFETFIIFSAMIIPAYLIYSFEKNEKPYFYSIMFFAVMAVNSALIYLLSKIIDSVFMGMLNVLGIYITIMIIPKNIMKRTVKLNVPKQSKMMSKEFEKGIEPLKDVSDKNVFEEKRKPAYLIEELERELEKAEKKHVQEIRRGSNLTKFDLSEEKSILDDPEVIDESEIVIEEIKPTKEKDLHPRNKSKKHVGKVAVKEIENLINEIEKTEEEEYDKLTENEETVIEEIKSTVEKDLHPRKKKKSQKSEINKISLKKVKKFISEVEKAEEDDYDKLTEDDEEIIEEIKPIKDITLQPFKKTVKKPLTSSNNKSSARKRK